MDLSQNYIYVLLDTTTNQVDTRGIGLHYLWEAMKQPVNNVLILSGPKNIGGFDDYTRFEVIRGSQACDEFIQQQIKTAKYNVKWVDYESQEFLHQLTPGEIAELLYLEHTNRHWHSPFFYKLQNNYVCLPGENNIMRCYYRHISEFFYQLAHQLRDAVQPYETRRSLFSLSSYTRHHEVAVPSPSVIKALRPLLYEGVVFDLSEMRIKGKLEIPIYLAEDRVDEVLLQLSKAERLGTLIYSPRHKEWRLESAFNSESFGG